MVSMCNNLCHRSVSFNKTSTKFTIPIVTLIKLEHQLMAINCSTVIIIIIILSDTERVTVATTVVVVHTKVHF